MKRKIYDDLLKWKNKKNQRKPLMVLGVRQCGKTYVIEDFCKNEYKHYKKINLFNDKNIVNLYKSNLTSDQKYRQFKVDIGFDFEKEDSILFIDEIQECEELISELKYFCEEHNNVNIICAGSLLGVKLNRMKKSYPVGKVDRLYLYPMDFEEYLMAFNEEMLIEYIKDCFINNTPMGIVHKKALDYYKRYLITGGMPESVQNMVDCNSDYINYDTTVLSNIIDGYRDDMNKHVESSNETLKINSIYNSLASQLMNASKKFQFSKVETGARARNYKVPLVWLENSNMIQLCECVTLPQKPLLGFADHETFKVYYSDIGILNNLVNVTIKDILNDELRIYKGIIAENFVANELKSNGIELLYWRGARESEVDFLLSTSEDGVIPIEVKADDNTQSKSLKVYNDLYKPKYMIRLSTKDFGYNPNTKIKSIPIYASYLLRELIK